MKRSPARRLGFETLEDRCTPSITSAVVSSNNVILTGNNAASNISIAYNAGTAKFDVTDSTNAFSQSYSAATITGTFLLRLGSGDDNVTFDLNGLTGSKNGVTAYLGDGANNFTATNSSIVSIASTAGAINVFGGSGVDNLTIGNSLVGSKALNVGVIGANLYNGDNVIGLYNGTVAGNVSIYAGTGNDTAFVGDGANTFQAGNSGFSLGSGNDADFLLVASNTKLYSLSSVYNEFVSLDVNSEITGNLWSYGINTFILNAAGKIGGDLNYQTYTYSTLTSVSLALASTGSVGRYLNVSAGPYNQAASFLTVDGTVNVAIFYTGTQGVDTVSISSTAVVKNYAGFILQGGNDTVDVAGTLGTVGQTGAGLYVDAGAGDDAVSFQSTAKLQAGVGIFMGAGTNSVSYDPLADFTNAPGSFVDWGGGTRNITGVTPGTVTNKNFV